MDYAMQAREAPVNARLSHIGLAHPLGSAITQLGSPDLLIVLTAVMGQDMLSWKTRQ